MTASSRSALLLILAAFGCLLAPAPALAQKPRAERPTYAIGDKWIRNDGVFDLIRVEKDLYVFAAEGGREIQMTKDLAIVRVSRRGEVEWELHPPPRLKWPLAVGKWGVDQVNLLAPAWPWPSAIGRLASSRDSAPVAAGKGQAVATPLSFVDALHRPSAGHRTVAAPLAGHGAVYVRGFFPPIRRRSVEHR